jgi:hypothetical protein
MSGAMVARSRWAVTRLLLLVLPFYALTAVYLDLRGPAHFHHHHHALDDDDHGRPHGHDHDAVERHHHPAADQSVVAVEDDAVLDAHALEEGGPSGWSATMCAALVSAGAALDLPRLTDGFVTGREPLLQTRFPGRLERPPRYYRA